MKYQIWSYNCHKIGYNFLEIKLTKFSRKIEITSSNRVQNPPFQLKMIKLELLTKNGAAQIGAKHKMTQSYWGAWGLRFDWMKVEYIYMSRLSTKNNKPKQQEVCTILDVLRHYKKLR